MTTTLEPYDRRQRRVALAYGVLCHVSFAAAIGSMMLSIGSGFQLSLGALPRGWAAVGNLLLLLQFALLHSFLLSQRGQSLLYRLAPLRLGRDLATTIYATIASWQLLIAFLCWTPSGVVWWQASGGALALLAGLYGAAWLLLLKTMFDAGLAVQTGAHGWLAIARGRQPRFAAFRPRGTFKWVRQPIYIAFAATMWTTPVWTPDGLALALVWTIYCLVGPRLKERRYARWHGAAWETYRATVPYWLPRPGRSSLRSH